MHEIARADDRTMRARREISHPPEVHDDIVYALALALYMMRKELKGGCSSPFMEKNRVFDGRSLHPVYIIKSSMDFIFFVATSTSSDFVVVNT